MSTLKLSQRSAVMFASCVELMRLADNETQASETKCTEACWTNYTRRVATWDFTSPFAKGGLRGILKMIVKSTLTLLYKRRAFTPLSFPIFFPPLRTMVPFRVDGFREVKFLLSSPYSADRLPIKYMPAPAYFTLYICRFSRRLFPGKRESSACGRRSTTR
jgi:hypothetical protein